MTSNFTPVQVYPRLKVVWPVSYPIYGPKKRSIVCYWTHEQKMDFEGLTQNGCYGNQPQSFAPFYKTRFDRQTSISGKFQFCSVM